MKKKFQWPSLRRKESPEKEKEKEKERVNDEEDEDKPPMSVNQIAEQLGMFPTAVEAELMKLQEAGAVKCYMYEGILYAVFLEDIDLSAFGNSKTLPEESSPMFG